MTPCAKCERPICDGVVCQDCAPSVVADAGAGDAEQDHLRLLVERDALRVIAGHISNDGSGRRLTAHHVGALSEYADAFERIVSEVASLRSALDAATRRAEAMSTAIEEANSHRWESGSRVAFGAWRWEQVLAAARPEVNRG